MFNATISGRLGNDPDMRYTPNGDPVCSFSLATDMGWGERKETTWFRVTFWRKQAESLANHFHKGDGIIISAKDLRLNLYDKNDGGQGVSLNVTGDSWWFPEGSKSDGGGSNGSAPRKKETKSDIPF